MGGTVTDRDRTAELCALYALGALSRIDLEELTILLDSAALVPDLLEEMLATVDLLFDAVADEMSSRFPGGMPSASEDLRDRILAIAR
jgi:hypothetical protein